MKKNGFTLIEILAVIAILSIIVVITAPIILNVNNSANNKISLQEKQNIEEAARFLAIDLDDYTSEIYNCKTGSWLYNLTTSDGGRKAKCEFNNEKWTLVNVLVENLIEQNYLNSSQKICEGSVTIMKNNSDYTIILSENVKCEKN